MFLVLSEHGREIWLESGSAEILSSRPLAPPTEGMARVHYFRPDGAYEGFELHVWEDVDEDVTWADGLDQTGSTGYGVYWDINLIEGAERVGFIVHKGDEKDPGPDMFMNLAEGNEIWLISGSSTVFTNKPDIALAGAGDLSKSKAYWVLPDTLAMKLGTVVPGTEFQLHHSLSADLELSETE